LAVGLPRADNHAASRSSSAPSPPNKLARTAPAGELASAVCPGESTQLPSLWRPAVGRRADAAQDGEGSGRLSNVIGPSDSGHIAIAVYILRGDIGSGGFVITSGDGILPRSTDELLPMKPPPLANIGRSEASSRRTAALQSTYEKNSSALVAIARLFVSCRINELDELAPLRFTRLFSLIRIETGDKKSGQTTRSLE